MPTPEEVRETYAQFVEAYNRHDVAAIGAFYADDAIRALPRSPEPAKGRAAVEETYAGLFAGFPDITIEFTTEVVEGDHSAVEWVFRGTHTGTLEGGPQPIPATGKTVEIRGACILRLNPDGKVAEDRQYYDLAGFMEQLGLMG